MALSKEQCDHLEGQLSSYWGCAKFLIGQTEISVRREKASESKTVLVVYINGEIKGSWYLGNNERPEEVPLVWRKRTKSVWTPKQIKRIEKDFGKRKAKTHFPDLYDKQVYHCPDFNSAKILVNQFKKIPEIELKEIGSIPYEDYLKGLEVI